MNRLFALLLGVAPVAPAAEILSPEARLLLTGQVRVLLEQKCSECHGAHLEKPEGKFGHVLDLPRLVSDPAHIIPGDPTRSELYRLLQDAEMPPGDQSKIAPLTLAERDAVRRWILVGAPTTLPAELPLAQPPLNPQFASQLSEAAAALKARFQRKQVSLDFKHRPAGEIVAEIARRSGLPVEYQRPAREPMLSITLQNGPAYDALEYLALRGNFALTFTGDAARIGPNPPPELPFELPPVLPKKKKS